MTSRTARNTRESALETPSVNCRLPAAHRQTASGHARRELFCGVAATSTPCSSNQCFSHATEENPLSARKGILAVGGQQEFPDESLIRVGLGQPEGSNYPF